jgi:hypothetical protein
MDKMRRSDQGTIYITVVGVTTLPGELNSNKGASKEMFSNESQEIVQLTSSILASLSKASGMEIQDTSWNSTIRHSLLGKVKNREDVFEFVRKLGKSKKATFQAGRKYHSIFSLLTPVLGNLQPRRYHSTFPLPTPVLGNLQPGISSLQSLKLDY